VTIAGKTHHAGQSKNVYIFPRVGLGVILSAATRVTDEMFFAAAKTLAAHVTDEDIREERMFPELRQIRKVSAAIAADVADVAFQRGLTKMARPDNVLAYVQSEMYEPDYPVYV
jgi:malate dehydrogenase (oxaloacetate-decarboxylating)(NADP+)